MLVSLSASWQNMCICSNWTLTQMRQQNGKKCSFCVCSVLSALVSNKRRRSKFISSRRSWRRPVHASVSWVGQGQNLRFLWGPPRPPYCRERRCAPGRRWTCSKVTRLLTAVTAAQGSTAVYYECVDLFLYRYIRYSDYLTSKQAIGLLICSGRDSFQIPIP
jgi:hypothetical protein